MKTKSIKAAKDMRCKICNSRLIRVTSDGVEETLDSRKYNIPFYCSACHRIRFPWRPIRDLVFIWDLGLPEYYHGTGIAIPDIYKQHYKKGHGIVLAIGSGYYTNKGVFKKTQLNVGDKVVYNKDVPWSMRFKGSYDDSFYTVVLCGEQDVWLECKE